FERAYPNASGTPALRDVQHALAREYGRNNWMELTQALEGAADAGAEAGDETRGAREQAVARFLEYACPDHHVRGLPAHRMARHAAMRVLEQNPEIARASIYTAVVCGETEE